MDMTKCQLLAGIGTAGMGKDWEEKQKNGNQISIGRMDGQEEIQDKNGVIWDQ